MKRIVKPAQLPLYILGAGVLGFALQTWLYATGPDATGLFQPGHPAEILLYLLTAVVVGIAVYFLRPIKGTPAYDRMFRPGLLPALGYWIAAAGIAIIAIGDFAHIEKTLDIFCAAAGVFATLCLVYHGLCRFGVLVCKFDLHSFLVVYLILHLVTRYRLWNSESQLQMYFFQLLASVFLMLDVYYHACLAAGKDARRTYAFLHYCACFFCCIAIQSDDTLFYLVMAVWSFTCGPALSPTEAPVAMELPEDVLYCIEKLESFGFSAYTVGGCVRDFILGLEPHDYDLCTNASPEEIADIFQEHQLVLAGAKHGTVGVVIHHKVYEITTFRKEGGYSDSRHPDWVDFVQNVEDDLSRRDFTVNSMAYSPSTGYVDPWYGQEDLERRLLRTVGNATTRFREDPLRILRGIRFAVTYKLNPTPKTERAMLAEAHLLDTLAKERVFSELCKLLPKMTAKDLLRYAPILVQVIPELAPALDFDQHSPHHAYDVFTHTAKVVEAVMPELPVRLAALLHDVGKPATYTEDENGRGHFYGHAQKGAEIADTILQRLKAPTTLRTQVVFLIEHHMTKFETDKKVLRRQLGKYGEDMALLLLELQKADFVSKGVSDEVDPFPEIEELIAQIQEEDACLTVKQLAVNGHDLLELGVTPGPHIGECMAFLLGLVQDEILENTREDLIPAARSFFKIEPTQEDNA